MDPNEKLLQAHKWIKILYPDAFEPMWKLNAVKRGEGYFTRYGEFKWIKYPEKLPARVDESGSGEGWGWPVSCKLGK